VALFRVGNNAEAVPVLEKRLAQSARRNDGWNLLVLAMCRQRLGQTERAEADLAQAIKWLDRQTGLSDSDRADLSALRSEAEDLLHLPK
jgi:Flp pilus assembly protein TadD